MKRKRVAVLALVLTIGAVATGCGGAGEEIHISMISGELREEQEQGGFALDGEEITTPGPTIRVPVGAEVTIDLENVHGYVSGEIIAHDIMVVVDRTEFPPEPLFEEADMELLEAGQSGSITFTADEAGRFFYICSVAGHVPRGMFGEFVVA